MYTLPNRPEQHINEQKSLSILLYSLRNMGIVRSITSNDYGIDLEYELVKKNQVTGRIIKIQLKARKKVAQTKQGYVTVSNIKQSTLNYWAEISYYTNVFIVLVDIESENIFISKPIFWDAIREIDNTKRVKSIKLKTYKEPGTVTPILIDSFTLIPNMMELTLYHKTFLSNLKNFIEKFYYAKGCDYDSEVSDYYFIDTLFSIARVLLWNEDLNKIIVKVNPEYPWYSKSAYYEKSYSIINYKSIISVLEVLLNHLIEYSIEIRNKMMETFTYWLCKDLDYYKFVLSNDLSKEMLTDPSVFDQFQALSDYRVNEIIHEQIKKLES